MIVEMMADMKVHDTEEKIKEEYPESYKVIKQLDQEIFEFAPHGYEHIKFKGLPYEEQYTLIENETKIFEEYLK